MGLGPLSSRPVAVSPPFWGWVCFGGLTGVVVHLRDAWRGFSSLGWLAGCSPGSLSFYFRAACFLAGCLGFYASFPPGEGSWFLRLAWRYGCRFWRRSLPLPMVFPWRWGPGVRLYLLGWFAILEVLVLKSRVSPFLMVSSLLAWCLEFWAPVPVAPPSEGGPLVLQFVLWSSRAPPDIWPRASVSLLAFDLLVAWSLRLWGDPCLWCSVALLPRCGCCVLCFVVLTLRVRTSLAPRLAGFTVPARSTRVKSHG